MPILHKLSHEMKEEVTLFNQYNLILKLGKDDIKNIYNNRYKILKENRNKLSIHTDTVIQSDAS